MERDIRICQKLSTLVVVSMDILHKIAQEHVIMLILLKKVSKTTKLRSQKLTNLWRRWDEGIHEQKDVSMHCTESSKINDEIDGVEAIHLCREEQTTTSEIHGRNKALNTKVGTK